jgi:hypothetical protein
MEGRMKRVGATSWGERSYNDNNNEDIIVNTDRREGRKL